ncbi:flippase [Clostridium botulinum]|nr:flippase [Clostridium botulinum]
MSYKRNIASNFLTQIIASAIGFFTSIIVARALGPQDKGYAAYILLIFNLIGEYGHFGITSASTYFQKKTKYSAKEVYDTNITYLFIVFSIISLTIIILKSTGFFLVDYSWSLIIAGLSIVLCTFLNTILINFYVADERIPEANKCNLIMNFLKSILILILWIFGNLNVFTFVLCQFMPLIVSILILYKNLGITYNIGFNKQLLKSELKFGIVIYLATLFIYLNYRMDQIFIKNMLGEQQLGIYSIAVSLAELLFLIPGSVGTAILGRLYNIKDNNKEKKYILSMTVKYTFYICLFIGILGIMMTPLIPYVYGKEFASAKSSTIILFIGIIFASIGKVSSSYFQSEGAPIIHMVITLITFLANLLLNALFIPKWGIDGAAAASTISYILYGLVYVVFFKHKEDFKISDFFMFNKNDYNILIKNNPFLKRLRKRNKK